METCCSQCAEIYKAWGQGNIQLGELNQQSAAYIAGYLSKKWTRAQSTEHRHPEFARMSLRPGIGLGMMHEIASTLMQHKSDEHMIDVPLFARHGSKRWPFGRYLRRNLRKFIGRDPNAPQEILEEQEKALQDLRQTAWDSQTSVKSEVLKASLGRRIQIEAKHRRKKREAI